MLVGCGLLCLSVVEQNVTAETKRKVDVRDFITMTRIAGPVGSTLYTGIGPQSDFASFSADGKQFIVVLRTGNLQTNANDYAIMHFTTFGALKGEPPRELATFSSRTNEEGVSKVTWLADNNTILFLGARGL